jgi:hypothetical protein
MQKHVVVLPTRIRACLVAGFHLPIVGTENKQLIHPIMSSAIE